MFPWIGVPKWIWVPESWAVTISWQLSPLTSLSLSVCLAAAISWQLSPLTSFPAWQQHSLDSSVLWHLSLLGSNNLLTAQSSDVSLCLAATISWQLNPLASLFAWQQRSLDAHLRLQLQSLSYGLRTSPRACHYGTWRASTLQKAKFISLPGGT